MKTEPSACRGFRFPAEVISHAVWLHHCFSLSLRDVETILAQHLLHLRRQTIEALAHVDRRQGQIDPHAHRRRQHLGRTPPRTAITLRNMLAATRSCTRSRQPFGSSISIVAAGSGTNPSPGPTVATDRSLTTVIGTNPPAAVTPGEETIPLGRNRPRQA